MHFLILGWSVGLKKKPKKKITRSLGIGGPGTLSLWTGSLCGERVKKSQGERRERVSPSPRDFFTPSQNRGPVHRLWHPGMTLKVNFHIIGLTKGTICCKKCSCFSLCCYYDHFSDRLKELFQVKSGLTTSLLFFLFLKMPQIWVGQTTLNREKKEDGLTELSGVQLVL